MDMLRNATRFLARVKQAFGLISARRLMGSQDGAAFLEFALVGPIFLALLVATIETALLFFAQEVLQTAASQSARLIMTGQAQTQQLTAAQFQQAVCSKLPAMFNCANLYVNVQQAATFSTLSPMNPLQTGNLNTSSMNYSPGVGGDIEVVQLFYLWPALTAPLGLSYADLNGKHLLAATAAFRNEPF